MLFLRIILLLVFSLILPKSWNWIKGPSQRQLCTSLLLEDQASFDDSIRPLLSQEFSYWKKGSQFYAFLSKDRRVVLKIPRASKIERMGVTLRLLNKKDVTSEFLSGLRHVSQFLMDESAVRYVHYGQAHQENPPGFILTDRLHRPISIELNQLPFVLQDRKKLLSKALEEASCLDEKKIILSAFFDLIIREYKKGWMCKDKAFWLNICYDLERAWRIDVGSYAPVKENFSLHDATLPLHKWIKKQNDPLLLKWFEEELVKREFSSPSSFSHS